jgi:hypothetical protein
MDAEFADPDLEKVRHMCRWLSRFWWTPVPPHECVFQLDGKTAGVGLLAKQDYGAFNLAYAMIGFDLDSEMQHRAFLGVWGYARNLSGVGVDGFTVGDMATLLPPPAFRAWHMKSAEKIPAGANAILIQISNNILQRLPQLR